MQLEDAATILARTEFFRICDAEQRRLLAFASERKRHKAASVIYQAGEMPQGAHVLVSGTVATYEQDESNPFVVSVPGSLFGAASLVIARARPVTIKAVDQVETLFVPRSGFMKLCNQFPDLAARARDRIRADLSDYLTAIETLGPKFGASSGKGYKG
ncbi:MAG: cyclic nucleotide-binding domain-containing protein [Devosia sp.]